jgi:hypothetical protein
MAIQSMTFDGDPAASNPLATRNATSAEPPVHSTGARAVRLLRLRIIVRLAAAMNSATPYCATSSPSESPWSSETISRLRGSSTSSKSSDGICSTVTATYAEIASPRCQAVSSRPLGKAISRWPRKATHRPSRAMPIVNRTSSSAALSEAPNHAKPVATISTPVRFAGRRDQANSPVPMNDHPTSRTSAVSRPRSDSWSLVRISAAQAAPARRPRRATPRRRAWAPRPRAAPAGRTRAPRG